MATYDAFTDIPSASPNAANIYVIRAVADYAKHPTAASDSLKIAVIDAGTVILGGMYKIVVGEGTASTKIDVGVSLADNTILNSVDINTAGSWTKITAPKFSADTFSEYASAGHVFVKNVALAADAAKVYFQFYCAKTTEDIIG
jgi:hypothetical protein